MSGSRWNTGSRNASSASITLQPRALNICSTSSLALLAYNGGSDFVNRSIRAAGTRDAFELTRLGYENDPHYLARVMATIIVMENAARKAYY